MEGFRHSLQTAIDLDPENITVHTLTLKRASNLVVEHRAADYADVAAMVESCELLEKAGYRPYYLYRQKGTLQNLENVGWCKPGYECLYNIYIMEEVHTILSAGAGGSTKLVAPVHVTARSSVSLIISTRQNISTVLTRSLHARKE